ncbi:MAG TPA: DEAD/DEAH box helicase [Candidatus Nanoarchaeia archaeon]|nr:DEAD/DEAH box helicase [Candidatus Nanoarchaeia archaeon]
MDFKNKHLDLFQEQAIESFVKGNSVVVSAPTGSGKTLIADYIIQEDLKAGKKVVYTAPIKALSNQKYKEFVEDHGADNVGILTGDMVINPQGMILVMTTEVFRNMAVARDPFMDEVRYVVLDEIHFLSDPERGHVWEESIVFAPSHVRFLCLSATIPNANELAKWIEVVKGHPVDVIRHDHRPVPLQHYVCDVDLGITTLPKLKDQLELDNVQDYKSFYKGKYKKPFIKNPSHLGPVEELIKNRDIPAIYFVFSRQNTQLFAKMLSKKRDLLSSAEKAQVVHIVTEGLSKVEAGVRQLPSTQLLRETLSKGVGFHHAGLLPVHKDIVEKLFGLGLVKILYATETFAVGINMPAKAVCLDSIEKFDGIHHRYLFPREYYQLVGRAGRRGIDTYGKAVVMVNRRFLDVDKLNYVVSEDKEPVKSQFKLTFNSVLNLIERPMEEIKILLKSNLDFFQKHGEKGFRDNRIGALMWAHYVKKKNQLEKMGYVHGNQLTEKGWFASRIYTQELTVTELFFDYKRFDMDEFKIILLLATVVYEPRRMDRFAMDKKRLRPVNELFKDLNDDPYIHRHFDFRHMDKLSMLMWAWFKGATFLEVIKLTNLLEGDVLRFFRQVIDLLTQVKKASTDQELINKLNACLNIMNRDLVKLGF